MPKTLCLGAARVLSAGFLFLQCHHLTPRVLPRLNTALEPTRGQPRSPGLRAHPRDDKTRRRTRRACDHWLRYPAMAHGRPSAHRGGVSAAVAVVASVAHTMTDASRASDTFILALTADLAGLPKNYIIRQMADYKSGARSTAVPGRVPPSLMIALSKPITDAEVEAAAAYFSALRPRKRIKVVESDTAPKTYIAVILRVTGNV